MSKVNSSDLNVSNNSGRNTETNGTDNAKISSSFNFGDFYSIVKSMIPTSYSDIIKWANEWKGRHNAVAAKIYRGISIDALVDCNNVRISDHDILNLFPYAKTGQEFDVVGAPDIRKAGGFDNLVGVQLHPADANDADVQKEVVAANPLCVGGAKVASLLLHVPVVDQSSIRSFLNWERTSTIKFASPSAELMYYRYPSDMAGDGPRAVVKGRFVVHTALYDLEADFSYEDRCSDSTNDLKAGTFRINLASQKRHVDRLGVSYDIVQSGVGKNALVYSCSSSLNAQSDMTKCWKDLIFSRHYAVKGCGPVGLIEPFIHILDAVLMEVAMSEIHVIPMFNCEIGFGSLSIKKGEVVFMEPKDYKVSFTDWVKRFSDRIVVNSEHNDIMKGANDVTSMDK